MPTTPPPSSSPEPDPGPGPPLSEQERRVLADLAANLQGDEPQVWKALPTSSRSPKPLLTLDRLAAGGLVLVIALVLLPADWLTVVVVLTLLVVVPLLVPLLLFLLAEPLFRSLSGRSGSNTRRPPDEVP